MRNGSMHVAGFAPSFLCFFFKKKKSVRDSTNWNLCALQRLWLLGSEECFYGDARSIAILEFIFMLFHAAATILIMV